MAVNPDELKENIRARLVWIGPMRLVEFIERLDGYLSKAGLNLRDYLIPIGIPGKLPSQLTPYEIAHLARFLHLNVPRASSSFEQAFEEITGHKTTSPLTEGSGYELELRRGRRAARPHIRRV